MVRTQISLTDAQYVAVKGIAADRGISMSAVIRETVDNLVALSQRSAIEGLADLAGAFASGRGDISARHDELAWEEPRE